MADRKSALLWAVGWWFFRRWLRHRAAVALTGVTAGAAATATRHGRFRTIAGALGLVAMLAIGFVVWRRLAGGSAEDGWGAPPPDEPVPPPAPTRETVAA